MAFRDALHFRYGFADIELHRWPKGETANQESFLAIPVSFRNAGDRTFQWHDRFDAFAGTSTRADFLYALSCRQRLVACAILQGESGSRSSFLADSCGGSSLFVLREAAALETAPGFVASICESSVKRRVSRHRGRRAVAGRDGK